MKRNLCVTLQLDFYWNVSTNHLRGLGIGSIQKISDKMLISLLEVLVTQEQLDEKIGQGKIDLERKFVDDSQLEDGDVQKVVSLCRVSKSWSKKSF